MQGARLTLLDAVLLGTAVSLLRGDALDALIVVVLGWGTLLRLLALCGYITSASVVRRLVAIPPVTGCSLALGTRYDGCS
jgi:energy-converting hydrogenase Eha subunit C